MYFDQPYPMILQPVEFALVPVIGIPDLSAGILTQVVVGLPRQIIRNEVLPHARPDCTLTDGEALKPSPVVIRSEGNDIPGQGLPSHRLDDARG
jgi:hypothetical protein